MATEVLELSVKTNIGETTQSMGSLKSQLKEAQQEVQKLSDKFGATSKEAVEAAKKAAVLKDRITDAKALTDAFNPDAKFKALSGALQGVAGGFAVVQGALGSMGVESEEAEKSMLKVQSAMAMAQGAQAIGESVDQFKNLGTVIKSTTVFQKASQAAQWLWNAAMNANPIGAIIVAITALIAAGASLIKFFKSSSAEAKANTAAIDANTKALANQRKQIENNNVVFERAQKHELAMAKARGDSAESIRKLEVTQANALITNAAEVRSQQQIQMAHNRTELARLKNADASKEDIARQQELVNESIKLFNESNQAVKKANEAGKDLKNRHLQEIATANTEANEKEVSVAKETAGKKAEIQKEIDDAKKQAAKDLEQEIKDIRDEAANQLIIDAAELADKLGESQLTEQQREENAIYDKYFSIIFAKKQNKEDVTELEAAQNQELAAITEKYAKEEAEKLLELQNENTLNLIDNLQERALAELKIQEEKELASIKGMENFEAMKVEIDKKYSKLRGDIGKEAAKKEIENEKAVLEAKKAIRDANVSNIEAGIGLVKDLAGENKSILAAAVVAENAVGIAKMIMANNTANVAALATPQAILTSGASAIPVIAANNISTAIGVASSIAATAKALSQLGGGGSAGSTPSLSGGETAAATTPAPQMMSGAFQLGGGVKPEPMKAFVVTDEMSNSQSQLANIRRRATI